MDVINQVLVIFLLMFTGFICAKIKLIGREEANRFSSFILNLTLPAMQVTALQRPFSPELLGECGTVLLISLGMHIFFFVLAFLYPRLIGMSGPERGVHRYAIIFSNSGFIGYPMVEAVLGPAYLFHAVVFNIPFNFLAYSIGAWLISKEGKRGLSLSWKTFINPTFTAAFLGFLFFIGSVSLSPPLYRTIKMIGDITAPLSMIVIGVTLAQADFRRIFGSRRLYLTTAMRLVIAPALWVCLCGAAGIRGPVLTLTALIAAMPAGSTTSILASIYDVSAEEGSCLVFLSTLFCVVTIPLMVLALTRIFLYIF
ncbi:MAG: AEC family transporter [Spirochaetaceae bacterium]|nr:AEC family transporter [Spirochaetaceae bacterium]